MRPIYFWARRTVLMPMVFLRSILFSHRTKSNSHKNCESNKIERSIKFGHRTKSNSHKKMRLEQNRTSGNKYVNRFRDGTCSQGQLRFCFLYFNDWVNGGSHIWVLNRSGYSMMLFHFILFLRERQSPSFHRKWKISSKLADQTATAIDCVQTWYFLPVY